MARTLAFLGPYGTYTEEAALLYDAAAELRPYPNISAVGRAVAMGETAEGVAPIENSIEGSVNFTLDLLISENSLLISYEIVLPIEHYLMGKPGTRLKDIQVVYSHPQALAQCREYLEKNFTNAERSASLSTAQAVGDAMNSDIPSAAIAPFRSAALYEAEILASGIQDVAANATRFVVLSKSDHEPTGNDKTSLFFTFAEDLPGQLYGVMGEFAQREINLAKIESRPTKQSLGQYVFFIDCDGHRGRPDDGGSDRGDQKEGKLASGAWFLSQVGPNWRNGIEKSKKPALPSLYPQLIAAPHDHTHKPGAVEEGRLGRASLSPRLWNAPTGGSEAQGTEAPDRHP